MYSLKERNSAYQATPVKAILAARRRRKLYPFFFHMGPVALCITSVLLIGLMAVLYLSQVGQAVATNQQLQNTRTQQAVLKRQNQDLLYTLAQEQSPAYIVEHAKMLGLVPADPEKIQVLHVEGLKPYSNLEENLQP